MLFKNVHSILPYSLQISESLLLPMFDNVNYLDTQAFLPTHGKVTAKFCTLCADLLSMTTMLGMEGFTCENCLLLGAPQAGVLVCTSSYR